MQSKKLVKEPIIKYHRSAKLNNAAPVMRCKYCLELSMFRVVQFDGVNRVACVLCLNSDRYNKRLRLHEQKIILNRPLTLREVFKRYTLRLKTYFYGNHIYGPFGRRRKK